MRKGVYSSLTHDDGDPASDCRAWFVLMDSGFRAGLGSLAAVVTPWFLRPCLIHPDSGGKDVRLCVPGQVVTNYTELH